MGFLMVIGPPAAAGAAGDEASACLGASVGAAVGAGVAAGAQHPAAWRRPYACRPMDNNRSFYWYFFSFSIRSFENQKQQVEISKNYSSSWYFWCTSFPDVYSDSPRKNLV
jgi:hypothetical protein